MSKTNAMRQLDQKKIPYETKTYTYDESDLGGLHVAHEVGLDPSCVFKTLVTHAGQKPYVFCIPCDAELDLKKAAKVAGEKSLDMVHVKDLLSLTGYIRGGCSPIGMKKSYPTWIDASVLHLEKVAVSGGLRGIQVILKPQDLLSIAQAKPEDLTRKEPI